MATYTQLIDSHVRSKYIPVLVDQIFKGNPFLLKMLAKSQVKFDSGKDIVQPIMTGRVTAAGYNAAVIEEDDKYKGQFDILPKNIAQSAVFNWADIYANITILDDMVDKVNGVEGVLNIVETYMQNAKETLNELLSKQLLYAAGSKGSGGLTADWLGLDEAIAPYNTAYGGINNVADWAGVVQDGVVMTMPAFQEILMSVTYGSEKPDLAITTPAIYNALWAQALPHQRILSDKSVLGRFGFTGLEIDGCQIMVDKNCPSGRMYIINTNFWKFILHKNKAFYWTPEKSLYDSAAYVRQLLVKGNFICTSRRMNAKLTNVVV